MRNQSQLSRADLLICLQGRKQSEEDAVAQVLGYARREAQETSELPPEPSPQPSPAPAPTPPPKPTAPKARFYRVVERHELKPPEEDVDQLPQASPLTGEIRAPEGASSPPQPALMLWSRLWPFLKMALGAQWATQTLDVPRIVDCLARGRRLRVLPRQHRHGWAAKCQIIVDYAGSLRPFWDDFDDLCQRLPEMRGKQGLQLVAFPDGDLGGRCWSYRGRGWRKIDRYPEPAPGAPVLVLSDLGCIDNVDDRRRQWRRLGARLRQLDCRLIALMPCPPRWWDRELTRLFYPVCWDRNTRPPQRLGSQWLQPAPVERADRESDAMPLLALLAPAIRVEPALLRAVRYLLPASTSDVGSEAAVWTHPSVHANAMAFYYDSKVIDGYRRSFKALDHNLKWEVAARIAEHHAHLSPTIGYEERWVFADLVDSPIPENAKKFFESLVRTLEHPDSFHAPNSQALIRRMSPRLHPDMWNYQPITAAWVMAHRAELQAGETVTLPNGITLERVSGLLAQGQPIKRYTLRQRGQALRLESGSPSASSDELDAPGSPLAEIQAKAPHVGYRWVRGEDRLVGDGQIQSLDQEIPLPENGRLQVRTDYQELIIDNIPKPDWAEAIGRDEYGLYAEFSIEGARQRMRWVAPGEFIMGSPESEPERESNEIQHRVMLSQGFWLADTACTWALWQAVMGKNLSDFKGEERPVENVSWGGVQGFIERLNAIVPGQAFRLPTEAEWEYTCRAGTTTPFWFGDQITPEQVNYDGRAPYAGGKKGQYRQETVDVKALPCNGWGLYQMHGNVWEWCQDWSDNYDVNAPVDPGGPGGGRDRVLRGGGWFFDGGFARAARRGASGPADRSGLAGFRLARGQPSGQQASTASNKQSDRAALDRR